MLNVLRENFREKPYLRFVLIAVAAAMVLSLGYYFTSSDSASTTGNWVARVDGVEIPEWRFRDQARAVEGRYREFLGENFDQLSEQLQIRQIVMNDLINRELILGDARRLGLRGSAQDLARTIRNHPQLQENGQFIGPQKYKSVLAGRPGGVSAFEKSLEEDLIASRWFTLVTQPIMVNDSELRDLFRSRTEKSAIDYVLYPAADISVDESVDDAAIQQYYDAHADEYLRAAGRTIRYVVIDRESQASKIEIPESEIEEYYQGNPAAYAHPAQRRASQILLTVPAGSTDEAKQAIKAEAEGLLEQLQSGADIALLAAQHSDDPRSRDQGGDVGYFAQGEMFESFEQAVFNTATGEYTPITETPHGFHVIQVTDSREAGTAPLAEVKDDIGRQLRFRQVDGYIKQEAEGLRAAIGNNDGFDAAAAAAGFDVETAFFSPEETIPGLAPSREFSETVAALELSAVSQPMRVGAGLAVVTVDALLPAAPAPISEVREQVSASLIAERRTDAAFTEASDLFDETKSLAAFASPSNPVQQSGDLAPGQPPAGAGGNTDELEARLFGDEGQIGNRGVIRVPAGAMIYEITARETFDETRFAGEKQALMDETLRNRQESYLQAILENLRDQVSVEYSARFAAGLDQG